MSFCVNKIHCIYPVDNKHSSRNDSLTEKEYIDQMEDYIRLILCNENYINSSENDYNTIENLNDTEHHFIFNNS